MLREVREELDRIEQFLMRRDTASADLAAILTALRSSDNSDDELKAITTSPLRSVVFPKLWESYHNKGEELQVGVDRVFGMKPPENLRTTIGGSYHFSLHHNLAVEAVRREDPR